MREFLDPLLQGASLQLALWAGLVGTVLLLLVGRLRRLRLGRGRARWRPQPAAEAWQREAEGQRRRAEAAYTTQGGTVRATEASSAPAARPILPGEMQASPSCPAAISRRIDRLEANVRARRAGSHG